MAIGALKKVQPLVARFVKVDPMYSCILAYVQIDEPDEGDYYA